MSRNAENQAEKGKNFLPCRENTAYHIHILSIKIPLMGQNDGDRKKNRKIFSSSKNLY